MSHNMIGQYVLQKLRRHYTVTERSIPDERFDKGPLHFRVKCYEVESFGRLCVFTMKGPLDLIRMETVVLSCFKRDLPLVNADCFQVGAKKTRIVECYDTYLNEPDGQLEQEFRRLIAGDDDLPDYESDEPYDHPMRLPYCYAKTTGRIPKRTEITTLRLIDALLAAAERAPSCDPEAKQSQVRRFTDFLLSAGGPAVEQVSRLFGQETAERLVRNELYGLNP